MKPLLITTLLSASTAAYSFTASTEMSSSGISLTEGDAHQLVTLRFQRDANDTAGACTVEIDAVAQALPGTAGSNATPGSDFEPIFYTTTLTLPAGQPTVEDVFSVPVIDDNTQEVTQYFGTVVTDVRPVDCDPSAIFGFGAENGVPIIDNDVAVLTISSDLPTVVTVGEQDGFVDLLLTMTISGAIEGPFFVDVPWNLVDAGATFGEDYGSGEPTGFLLFDETTLSHTFSIPIHDDAVMEAGESFEFQMETPFAILPDESMLQVDYTTPVTRIDIQDDDNPGHGQFTGVYEVREDAGEAVITLLRSSADGELTATVRTTSGNADADLDYVAIEETVSWPAGDASERTVVVPIVNDDEVEDDEFVVLQLEDSSGFLTESTLTIIDDDTVEAVASFAETEVSAPADGDVVELKLVRGGSAQGQLTVEYFTEDGTAVAGEDYEAAAGMVTWEDGDVENKAISVTLLRRPEETVDFSVFLGSLDGVISDEVRVLVEPAEDAPKLADIASLTPNQSDIANYFDDVCDGAATDGDDLNEVCEAVLSLGDDPGAVRQALDAINPEELTTGSRNTLRLSTVQQGNLSQRVGALRSGAGGGGVDLTGLNLEIGGQQIAGAVLQEIFNQIVGGGASADEGIGGRWGAFLNGRLATGDRDRTANGAGYSFDLHTLTVGVDYRVKPTFIVGVSAGFGWADSDFRGDAGGMEVDSWNASAYMTWFNDQNFYLDGMVTYGRNDYESERRIRFGSGAAAVDRTALGDTDGDQVSIAFNTGWDFNRGGLVFGPHVGGYLLEVDVDGFAETGAGALGVRTEDQTTKSFTVSAGAHASWALLTDWGVLVPNAKVDWVHEFENLTESLAFTFVNDPFTGNLNDPAPRLRVQTDRPDSDYFIWSVGTSAQFIHGFSGFVNYQSFVGYRDMKIHDWSLGLRWEKNF